MSDQVKNGENSQSKITMAAFLESVPPNQRFLISDLVEDDVMIQGSGLVPALSVPEIQLHCTHESCNGQRFFRCGSDRRKIVWDQPLSCYLNYWCSNCQNISKTFSLFCHMVDVKSKEIMCFKYGENPPFGPPTPARLISLVGPDRDIFLRGRRCENQGLGIGSFSYYRRVVENQKNRILEKIIGVAEKLKAPEDMLNELKEALNETQFTKALSMVKGGIPEILLINGQNPLKLLHKALSVGVHDKSDKECLVFA